MGVARISAALVCSAILADELGIDNPGQIYHVRAQQEENEPPAEECLPRNIGN